MTGLLHKPSALSHCHAPDRLSSRMVQALTLAVVLGLAPSCAPHRAPVTGDQDTRAQATNPTPSPRLDPIQARQAEAEPGLPFVRDDYAAARAMALEQKRPIFAEVWAKW